MRVVPTVPYYNQFFCPSSNCSASFWLYALRISCGISSCMLIPRRKTGWPLSKSCLSLLPAYGTKTNLFFYSFRLGGYDHFITDRIFRRPSLKRGQGEIFIAALLSFTGNTFFHFQFRNFYRYFSSGEALFSFAQPSTSAPCAFEGFNWIK